MLLYPIDFMIYQESYFNNCHGVIPQIVLSSMLVQAGNIRASAYKNALTVDLSSANTFNFNGYFLTLQGILPFVESRYLLTVPSIINRVGAMNSENVDMLNDLIGLPVNGFTRTAIREVVLPTKIDNLSQGVLVLEKRLAYLLLLQAKRNNLNTLYNYLYYATLASDFTRRSNVKLPLISNNGAGNYISGWIYSHTIEPRGRSASILALCMINLYNTYPSLYQLIPIDFTGSTTVVFESVCSWLELEMGKSDPVTLPDLDFDLLVSNIAEYIQTLRYVEPLRDPEGLVENDAIDVSSEIVAGTDNGLRPTLPLPTNVYSYPDDFSPLDDRPSANNSSLRGNAPTTSPLPAC